MSSNDRSIAADGSLTNGLGLQGEELLRSEASRIMYGLSRNKSIAQWWREARAVETAGRRELVCSWCGEKDQPKALDAPLCFPTCVLEAELSGLLCEHGVDPMESDDIARAIRRTKINLADRI